MGPKWSQNVQIICVRLAWSIQLTGRNWTEWPTSPPSWNILICLVEFHLPPSSHIVLPFRQEFHNQVLETDLSMPSDEVDVALRFKLFWVGVSTSRVIPESVQQCGQLTVNFMTRDPYNPGVLVVNIIILRPLHYLCRSCNGCDLTKVKNMEKWVVGLGLPLV